MDNVEFFIDFQGDEFAKIDRGNGEYTTMPKATYDEQQAEASLSTPIVSGDGE